MKIKLSNIFISFLTIVAFSGYAQKATVKKATYDYNNFSYVKTSDILLDVANKGFKSVDLFQKLGNSFYFNNKMEEAAKWYGELMNLDEVKLENNLDPEYYYRYAQALKSIENYDESDKWMQKFSEVAKDDIRVRNFEATPNYLKLIDLQSEDIEIINLPFNSALSDFGTTLHDNEFIFASSRGNGKNYKWNDQPFLELYSIEKQDDDTFENLKKFNENVNTKYHESSVAFSPDGKTMYFTRNNFFKKRLKRDENGVNRLQLYSANKAADNSWENIKPVHFNSESYSVAHPTINAKGDKLIFASDMPGTIGLSDLYSVDINSDGTLGTPINLGPSINTEAQETFPFLNEKGDLYYSSNGYSGLGGLDIYTIQDFENKLSSNGTYTVKNVGKPINSPNDDFAYYEDLKVSQGYFSSNREGGKGDDDIYWFKFPDCVQKLTGKAFDKKTNQLLAGSHVVLLDKTGTVVAEQTVGDDANYNFDNLNCDSQYLVRASKETYETSEIRVSTGSNRKEQIVLDSPLTQNEVRIAVGTNLWDAFGLNPIYFDLDKSNIRPDAEIELQKIVAVLDKYPTMEIDVRSHTDSRATASYNNSLSSRRNKSTINYLIKVGKINADRLTGKGYGESELLNKCSDGVPCTEEEHQLNRRSDFIITKM
ncbi:WD40 repeat protein [Mariniflexile fucanivorans]|uniref:WD40 repeat protein n=1 Tax=Mariniflexile fucanivorans TaxID=264023 RepID=A0A4R1RDU5_9FLAO|nr:OmpA family protein [Mariniflexile fucanivorans]TCL63810.1 WD40 repeat protein [Mariniflexile fucanivorans]